MDIYHVSEIFLVTSIDLPSKQLSERNIFPHNFTLKTEMYDEEEVRIKSCLVKNGKKYSEDVRAEPNNIGLYYMLEYTHITYM